MRLLLNRAQSALAGSGAERPARSAGLHASTARGGLEHARPRGRGHAIESKRGVNKSTHARIYRSSENSEHFRHTSLLKPSRLWGARCTVQGAGRCSHLHYPLLPHRTRRGERGGERGDATVVNSHVCEVERLRWSLSHRWRDLSHR